MSSLLLLVKMVSSNSSSTHNYQVAALILEISLAPIFGILLIPLSIMMLRRFQTQKSWKTQMSLNMLMISAWFYCISEIAWNILIGLGGFYELDNLPIYIASNCATYLHFTMFAFVSMSYIYTLIKASISFEIIVSRSNDTYKQRGRKRIILRTMRIGSLMILISGSLLVTCGCVAICILYGLNKYDLISNDTYLLIIIIVLSVSSIPTLIAYVFVLFIFVFMFVYTMKKSGLAIANQKDSTLKDKIIDRKVKIVRHTIGFVLYCLHAIIVGGSVIWYLARYTDGTLFESILIDILLRIIPTYIFLLAIIVVFWPYLIPKVISKLCICETRILLFSLAGRALNTRIDMDTEDGISTVSSIEGENKEATTIHMQ